MRGAWAAGLTPSLAAVALAFTAGAGCISVGAHQKSAPALKPEAQTSKRALMLAGEEAAELSTSFARVKGAWLRVREGGASSDVRTEAKTPVVFVHGYGSRLEAWREIQPAIAADRRTFSFDQRGFGESERPEGEYGPDVHAKDLIALLDIAGIERAIVVGHSYGGGVATRAALLAPSRIVGVALVDAFVLDKQVPQLFRWAKAPLIGELLFGAFYKEVPGEKYLLAFHDRERFVSAEALDEMKELMSRPGSVYAALETVRGMNYAEWEGDLETLRAPTLVVWGEDDRVTPLAQGKALAARLDTARFVPIAGCGHMPSWERPRALLAALTPFFDEVDAHERKQPTAADLPAGEDAGEDATEDAGEDREREDPSPNNEESAAEDDKRRTPITEEDAEEDEENASDTTPSSEDDETGESR